MLNSQNVKDTDAPTLSADAQAAFRGGAGLLSVQLKSYEVWYARAIAEESEGTTPTYSARDACLSHARRNGATPSDIFRIRVAGAWLYLAGQYA